jgi:hypothetical protein
MMRRRLSRLLLLFFTAATTYCRVVSAQAAVEAAAGEEVEQVKWTANPSDVADDGSGPLPLSTQQRHQLTELERVIRQSPDPQATLRQVAASNDMDPQDLANILQRNRSDLTGGGGGGGPLSARNNPITQLLGAVTVLLQRYPKLSTGIITITLIILYLRYIEIPRTGLCLSTSRSSYWWWSRGPTTFLAPPNAFIQRLLSQVEENETTTTTVLYQSLLETYPITSSSVLEPGVVQSIKKRNKLWKRAFVTEQTISLHRRRSHHHTRNEEEVEEVEDEDDVDDILLDQASRLLTDPRTLVEWIPGVRIMASSTGSSSVASNDKNDDDDRVDGVNQKQKIALVYPGFGDFRRYALLSFVVTEQPSDQRLVLSTAKGSYFDGQLIIDIIATPDHHHHRVRVSMIVVKGRALPKTFLADMASSIAKSVQARTRQVLARRAQSERYRASSQAYVAQRRTQRDVKAREMEEMNADRRRRWQRTNPNAGQYRPSGERMRSPNNAVY